MFGHWNIYLNSYTGSARTTRCRKHQGGEINIGAICLPSIARTRETRKQACKREGEDKGARSLKTDTRKTLFI